MWEVTAIVFVSVPVGLPLPVGDAGEGRFGRLDPVPCLVLITGYPPLTLIHYVLHAGAITAMLNQGVACANLSQLNNIHNQKREIKTMQRKWRVMLRILRVKRLLVPPGTSSCGS